VFLCIFVFLTSVAAFWPYEFFNSNLATLDQLNYWYPLIMLVFIPAITMSIWAEEKRQGTDELLLTLPADDFDIVIGKYMSAAAIFTASLLFSQVSAFVTLAVLTEGSLDTGLIFTTYLGYWFVGLTMIAIGMIASFLTGNLTVGFILGALFNAPLAFASLADSVSPNRMIAEWLSGSGIARPFDDFGRGVISMSSVVYFVLVAAVALYACMVLIGRRHWTGGKDGNSMVWHYLARTVALAVFTVGAVTAFRSKDLFRHDATEGKVSSLADATKDLIRNLDADRPIVVDAFISDEIPELYAKTRYELVNLLKEFKSEASKQGRTIELNLYDGIELFSEDAALAAERFGIEPVQRTVREKGAIQQKSFILGAAFKSGLQKVTVPVFEYGIPTEYELVRSINTVARGAKKRLGLVSTDARLMGGVVTQGMQMQRVPKHPLVVELAKQYEVEEVDMSAPVTPGMYDALLAVQPSSLAPPQFERFVNAVKSGVPTAIFEDPVPAGTPYITATAQPKQAAGGMAAMFGGGGQPEPKGDIRELWEALELDVPGQSNMSQMFEQQVAWQTHNPYPNLSDSANDMWVFVDENIEGIRPGDALSDDNPITSGLSQILAIIPGVVAGKEDGALTHTPLMSTGPRSGSLSQTDVRQVMARQKSMNQVIAGSIRPNQAIAMAIEGPATSEASDSEEGDEGGKASSPIRVVYVADADLMLPDFLQLRENPDMVQDAKFQFQNVTFLLNSVDWLTDETQFIAVRNHEPIFASLKMIDAVKNQANEDVRQKSEQFEADYDQAVLAAEEAMQREMKDVQEEVADLQKKREDGTVPNSVLREKMTQLQISREAQQRALAVKTQRFKRVQEQNVREIERKADQQVTSIQTKVKTAAVVFPCIPPLVVGVIVFASRRLRERENITKARLK
ncbi:MAG: Gldg family protein, partial [Planctomycetota bacterium]